MQSPPAGLAAPTVASAVADGWGLRVSELRYLPVGGGSHHWLVSADRAKYFLTVDDLEDKPWLGADRESVFEGLRAALDTALALRNEADLAFVLAPVPSGCGETARRLSPRYGLAVYPFVAGQTGQWGRAVTAPDRDRLGRVLAELHQATPAVTARAARRSAELHERAELEAALAELDRPWTGGPFSESARQELARNAEAVTRSLAEFDDLAAYMRARGTSLVVTHGEPHPGNIMRVGSRLMLIDWDTVALAPPERDLWMLADGSDRALSGYHEATGRTLDSKALSFYRLAWRLADIAAFAGVLRSAHERDRNTEHARRSLTKALDPKSPAPFG